MGNKKKQTKSNNKKREIKETDRKQKPNTNPRKHLSKQHYQQQLNQPIFKKSQMVAKKHVCQLILLLVPSLITIGLLGYCLLSDQWTQISQTRLARVQELYGDELDDFLASR